MDAQPDKTNQPLKKRPLPKRLLTRLRTILTAGVIVIAPLAITLWVLHFLYRTADGFSGPLVRLLGRALGDPEFHIPGLGFLLTFFILWVVGIITTNVVGKRLLQNGQQALERLPIVRTIYAPVRKLMETMTAQGKAGFKQVVLVEYPRKELWTLGFVAGDVPRPDYETAAHSIFVPTAPNPTTGFMLIVPPEQMRPTDLSVEEAFQMIVSAGVAVPASLSLPAEGWEETAAPS
jgi:uncharacterized membrane protein